MTGSKYCGILTSKQAMSFKTEDQTQFHCTKSKKCHFIDFALCLAKKFWAETIWKGICLLYRWSLSKVVVVPVAIRALSVILIRLKYWMKKLDVKSRTFAQSSIVWNCKDCKVSPGDLRLMVAIKIYPN